MILTDASVVIVYERVPTPRLKKIIADEEASVCGVTVAELYAGVRSAKDEAVNTGTQLVVFSDIITLDDGNLTRRCRRK
jgi:predicted nucleic acid-binding protein